MIVKLAWNTGVRAGGSVCTVFSPEVAGPNLAGSLTNLGLIDEYRLYLHPIVLGRGKPFFSGPRPPLRLVTSDLVGEDVIRLTYVPA
jgi:riboflavin biosynthesis pyrimidine reductase